MAADAVTFVERNFDLPALRIGCDFALRSLLWRRSARRLRLSGDQERLKSHGGQNARGKSEASRQDEKRSSHELFTLISSRARSRPRILVQRTAFYAARASFS